MPDGLDVARFFAYGPQGMTCSQIDQTLVWELMRFPDEAETGAPEARLVPRMVPRGLRGVPVGREYCMGAGGFEPPASRV